MKGRFRHESYGRNAYFSGFMGFLRGFGSDFGPSWGILWVFSLGLIHNFLLHFPSRYIRIIHAHEL